MLTHARAALLLLCPALAATSLLAQEPRSGDEEPSASDQAERESVLREPFMWRFRRDRLMPPDFSTPEESLQWKAAREHPAGGTWLGVRLCPVPAALTEHLKLGDRGVMICNIFTGSPADEAALDRFDVIVQADGQATEGGLDAVRKFSQHVRDKKPGDTLELVVIHQGEKKALAVQLGEAPADWRAFKPKYEDDPDVAHLREFGMRGKILRPGPDGWIMEDLGELPPGFRERLDRGFSPPWGSPRRERERDADREARPPESVNEARRTDRDGNVLHVRRDESGEITVKRYAHSEDEKSARVKTYANMEQLLKADPEAFDLLHSADPSGLRMRPEAAPDRPDRRRGAQDRRGPASAQPEARNQPRRQRPFDDEDELAGKWREWGERFFQEPMGGLPERDQRFGPAPARTRFEVSPEGRITVHSRGRDAELTMTFNSREELREKAPELFEQFERLEARMRSGEAR